MLSRSKVLGAAVAFALTAAPAAAPAAPSGPGPDEAGGGKGKKVKYVRGARSLGDPLFPQIGNGGYDARSYTIELDYDPVANIFNSARTTMVARATKNLSSFSMDFQDLDVARVTVNGREARFRQREATPELIGDPDGAPDAADEADRQAPRRPAQGAQLHRSGPTTAASRS